MTRGVLFLLEWAGLVVGLGWAKMLDQVMVLGLVITKGPIWYIINHKDHNCNFANLRD